MFYVTIDGKVVTPANLTRGDAERYAAECRTTDPTRNVTIEPSSPTPNPAFDRVAAIVAAHDAARTVIGVKGSRRSGLTPGAPSRIDAERVGGVERARDAERRADSAQRAEVKRLNARRAAIGSALADAERAGDAERAARLGALGETIGLRVAALTDATFNRPATYADWLPGGRFAKYARRFDLGFIGWDADDLAMEAWELIERERVALLDAEGSAPLRGVPTETGSATAGHTLGDGYRAVKRAYRIGLGFYGYERRGTVIERDATPRGYATVESDTVRLLRLRGEDESAVRARIFRDDEAIWEADDDDDERDVILAVDRRRRALDTLTRRFPLNADGRMLALATLLAEGYALGEALPALGVTERTAERWAAELGHVAA